MTRRTLTLRKETLTELTADDLRQIAGASGVLCPTSDGCGTGYYPSIFDPCLSVRICLDTR